MASAMLVRSAGKAGQGPSSILETASPSSDLMRSFWSGRHHHVVAVDLDLAAEPLEAQPGHAQVVRHHVADAQLAAGAGGERDEAAHLDVVGPDRVVGAAQLLLAVHDHQVRADALDAGAHLHQQASEVLHVRLAGGVVDHRGAGRQRGGHQGVLGGHHRRLVHEEVACVQARRGPTAGTSARRAPRRRGRGRRRSAGRAGGGRSRRRRAAACRRARSGRAAARPAGTRRGCARPARGPPRCS